jgi:hypothetical protein
VRLRENRREAERLVAHTHGDNTPLEGGERAIEETAAIAEPVAAFVEAVHRNDRDVGKHDLGAIGNRNVIDAPAHRRARPPRPKLERLPFPHDFG